MYGWQSTCTGVGKWLHLLFFHQTVGEPEGFSWGTTNNYAQNECPIFEVSDFILFEGAVLQTIHTIEKEEGAITQGNGHYIKLCHSLHVHHVHIQP